MVDDARDAAGYDNIYGSGRASVKSIGRCSSQ